MNLRRVVSWGAALPYAVVWISLNSPASEAVISNGIPTCLGFADGGAGFGFSPSTNLLLTTLGFLSNDQTSSPALVRLWDNSGAVHFLQGTERDTNGNWDFWAGPFVGGGPNN